MLILSGDSTDLRCEIPDAGGELREYAVRPVPTGFQCAACAWQLLRLDTEERHHVVVDVRGIFHCSCGDARYRHGGLACKHITALRTVYSLSPRHPFPKDVIPMLSNPFENRSPRPEEAPAFEVPPADTHYGYLIGLIDLGVHVESFQGQNPKPKRKCVLLWELTECKKTDGSNFVVYERYTCDIPLHPKSRLRKDLETWRRRPYEPGEDIPITKFVGWPWSLDLTHQVSTGADGQKKVFVKVSKVGNVKKNTVVPPPTHDSVIWFAGCGRPIPDMDWLPHVYGAKISDLIAVGLEGLGRPAAQQGNGKAQQQQQEPAREEQEIPF